MTPRSMTESDLREVLDERSATVPPSSGRVDAVISRVRRRRRRAAATVLTAAVVIAVAVGSGLLVTRATSSPSGGHAPAYPRVDAGGVVVQQFSGNGQGTRSATVVWPNVNRVGATGLCQGSGDAVMQIAVDGVLDSSPCGPGAWYVSGDWSHTFPGIHSGQAVHLSVSVSGSVGQWSFALLNMDPHWTASGTSGVSFPQVNTAPHSPSPLVEPPGTYYDLGYYPNSDTFIYRAQGTAPTIILECSQAGRLAVLMNGHELGAVTCPNRTWSEQFLMIAPGPFELAGWHPGALVTVTLHWSGSPFVPYRIDLGTN
jgi:hypothetical protein